MKYLNEIVCGDCRGLLKDLPNNSVDALVTDPPYGLEFMGKEWDRLEGSGFSDGKFKGFRIPALSGTHRNVKCPDCGKWIYDHHPRQCRCGGVERLKSRRQIEWHYLWATEALRVLKPGAHALVFGGTRTYHRMVCALEDAGFEIRDTIIWLYGSGFPKNYNISKGIDKKFGAEREIVSQAQNGAGNKQDYLPSDRTKTEAGVFGGDAKVYDITAPATELAQKWAGWGTALKPACELICLARKPLSERNIVENVLKYGTAGLNIDGGRIGTKDKYDYEKCGGSSFGIGKGSDGTREYPAHSHPQGRWPANLILDEESAAMLDEQSGQSKSSDKINHEQKQCGQIYGWANCNTKYKRAIGHNDFGGASRFFYCAKSSRRERNIGLEGFEEKRGGSMEANITDKMQLGGASLRGRPKEIQATKNNHPTVKPLKLMEYLVNLITPPGGIVLDPFIGSGTTAMACKSLGFDYIGFEKEAEYVEIARARVAAIERGLFK